MCRAYTVGDESGFHPVSRVWRAVTVAVQRLDGNLAPGKHLPWEALREEWRERLAHTEAMLAHPEEALRLRPGDEDLRRLRQGLEVGWWFSKDVFLLLERRVADSDRAQQGTRAALDDLAAYLDHIDVRPTDVVGGDPACWQKPLEQFAGRN